MNELWFLLLTADFDDQAPAY